MTNKDKKTGLIEIAGYWKLSLCVRTNEVIATQGDQVYRFKLTTTAEMGARNMDDNDLDGPLIRLFRDD